MYYPKWLKYLFLMPAIACLILVLTAQNTVEVAWLAALFGIIGSLIFGYLRQNEQRWEQGRYRLSFQTSLTEEQCIALLQSRQIQDALTYEMGYDTSRAAWWIAFDKPSPVYPAEWSRYYFHWEQGQCGVSFELTAELALFGMGSIFLWPSQIEEFFKGKLNALPLHPHRPLPEKPPKKQ